MSKKGFTLVELMVVVAIVAILSAVALPMFSSFRQKSKVSSVIKGCTGASTALQNWFSETNTFTGIAVSTTGGALRLGSTRIGAGLPTVPDVEWSIVAPSASTVRISWNFLASCPTDVCNGYWELICFSEDDRCNVEVRLDSSDTLGLNIP